MFRLIAIDTVLSGVPQYQLGLWIKKCCATTVKSVPLQIGSPLQLADRRLTYFGRR